jgi:hypothetical protein
MGELKVLIAGNLMTDMQLAINKIIKQKAQESVRNEDF